MMGRVALGVRYAAIAGVLLVAVGVAGRFIAWPLLTTTLGPTVYVFAANPRSETTRLRDAGLGHAVAVGFGLAALAVFGLWHRAPVSATGGPSLPQVAAAAAAAAFTLFVLELAGSHHAPAAATALLVATGLARPGKPLEGLVIGLAIVLILGPLSGRLPLARAEAARREKAPAPQPERLASRR